MFTGILLKIISAFFFTLMAATIRWIGDSVPVGEVAFSRSFFAFIPVAAWLAWRGELASSIAAPNLGGHFLRSLIGIGAMFLTFSALARLPLPDATVISYAAPLITVVLAALILKERIGGWRWGATLIGLVGVMIILSPHLADGSFAKAFAGDGETRLAQGALLALAGACCSACGMIQIRRLALTERTGAIVVYFSLFSSLLSLLSLPFGWRMPDLETTGLLVLTGCLGGVGQILLTSSYRKADASLIAPFEYTTILWALLIGWLAFDDVPAAPVFFGGAIVVSSGVFVILRERALGIERARARKASSPPAT